MSDRPKRTLRKPNRLLEDEPRTAPASSSALASRAKRKRNYAEDGAESLLTSPKSELTSMDISDLINPTSWEMLSPESRAHLSTLLPRTAYSDFAKTLDSEHPSRLSNEGEMYSSGLPGTEGTVGPAEVLPSTFSDPHFLAAAHTFQDHIYSNWRQDDHKSKVSRFEQGIRDGSMAAAWKDEEWENDNKPSTETNGKTKSKRTSTADIRIYDLAKNDVIRVGDIIAYKHHFALLNLTVEKDVLIHAINSRSRAITVLLTSGVAQHLPPYLLVPNSPDPLPPIQSMDITSPTMLETGVLDLEGRVPRTDRPNGNAWKALTVHRWREENQGAVSSNDPRGGRENHGTLHYLRSSHFSDR